MARRAAARLVDDLRSELDGIIVAQQADPPDDEHDVEGASVGFERARVTALLAAAEARVTALEAAGARAARGATVTCLTCGREIAPERLAAVPETTTCIACATTRPPGISRH